MIITNKLCIGSIEGKNEDAIGYGDNFIFVIDGATTLHKKGNSDYSDASWLSNRLSVLLKEKLPNLNRNIDTILYDCLDILKKEFNNMYKNKLLSKVPSPSAGICIFREKNEVIEAFRLGDVLGIIEYNNNKIDLMQEKNLSKFDKIAIEKQIKIAKKKNISVKEARLYINKTLIKHRKLMNKKTGYYILDLSAKGIKYGEYKIYNKSEIKSISCMSDGFSCIVDTYKIINNYDNLQLFLKESEVLELYKKMKETILNDLDYNIYPRFKLIDDSSVICAVIK